MYGWQELPHSSQLDMVPAIAQRGGVFVEYRRFGILCRTRAVSGPPMGEKGESASAV